MQEKNDVRTRLQTSALELFREQGYDGTTAAAIASRAGVTERTFFRYFPDKREVLFDGEAMVRDKLLASITDAPEALGPIDVLFEAFHAFQPSLEAKRAYAKRRQEVIAANPALHERELAKIDALVEALADALRARGISALRANLAARTCMMAFVQATLLWLDDSSPDFGTRIEQGRHELTALFTRQT